MIYTTILNLLRKRHLNVQGDHKEMRFTETFRYRGNLKDREKVEKNREGDEEKGNGGLG